MGRGRVGKRYQLKNKQKEEDVRIRCKEKDCNECWNSVEEMQGSGGCSWHGCKIATAQQQQSKEMADEAINKAKNGSIKMFHKSFPVHQSYKPKEGETVIEKEWPPLEAFRIMK